MATLIEHFISDFNSGSIDQEMPLSNLNGEEIITVKKRIILNLTNNSRFFAFYVPDNNDLIGILRFLIDSIPSSIETVGVDLLFTAASDITIGGGIHHYVNTVYFYLENIPTSEDLLLLEDLSLHLNFFIKIRTNDYANHMMKENKPMAFISHDSRNKDLIARPLANKLLSRLCTVWYDEYSMHVGDSLKASIEKGIKEAKKCILILTPEFLNNPGWGKREFDSIFTREMIMEERIIIPIWHNVSKKDVYDYSPSLADTLALVWPDTSLPEIQYEQQVQELISKLHTVIIAD